MSYPGDHITPENEGRRERKLHVAIYFHANDDELQSRSNELRHVIESALATEDDPKVREYTYVEAVITGTENP